MKAGGLQSRWRSADTRSDYRKWKEAQAVKSTLGSFVALGAGLLAISRFRKDPNAHQCKDCLRRLSNNINVKLERLLEFTDDLKDTAILTGKYFWSGCKTIDEKDPTILSLLDGKPWRFIRRSQLPLLPDRKHLQFPKNLPTLVLDLDKILAQIHYDNRSGWRVLKRPFADEFVKELLYSYELVIWSKEDFPVAQNLVAQWGIPVIGTLHRENCSRIDGSVVRDLSRLGRDLSRTVIVSADPAEQIANARNVIMLDPFENLQGDRELRHLAAYLSRLAKKDGDLRGHMDVMGRTRESRMEMAKSAERAREMHERFRNVSRYLFGK